MYPWFFFLFYTQKVMSKTTTEEIEDFLLTHGDEIIDMLGEHVDRLEKQIKVSLKYLILVFDHGVGGEVGR